MMHSRSVSFLIITEDEDEDPWIRFASSDRVHQQHLLQIIEGLRVLPITPNPRATPYGMTSPYGTPSFTYSHLSANAARIDQEDSPSDSIRVLLELKPSRLQEQQAVC
jgi:hypothetical protein